MATGLEGKKWAAVTASMPISSRQIIDVLCEIYDINGNEPVTRAELQLATGLQMTIVDDRLKTLVDDGVIQRARRGRFVPICPHRPARVISVTRIDDGIVKIEIGDDLLELVPREARMLGKSLAWEALSP